MAFRRGTRIEIKTSEQFQYMRQAGLVVCRTLNLVKEMTSAGMTTNDIDAIAREQLAHYGAESSFLGYHGYPATICVSVNEEVVHGIPGKRALHEGDIVSVDFGAVIEGWHGDAAISFGIGELDEESKRLIDVTERALWAGLAKAVAGNTVSDISHAVESTVRADGDWQVIEDYVGHGIGSRMHMEPPVPNYGPPGKGPQLRVGMAVAVEPMITVGTIETKVLVDDWTVVTTDDSRAAHWEHTVCITDEGPWVTTALDGGHARLTALGLSVPLRA